MSNVVPEAVGLSSNRLAYLQTVMQNFIDQGQVAGLITLIARRGKIAHFECYGHMDLEANKAMRPDTIFRIASMTKPITTVALLMLFEAGRLILNEPVGMTDTTFYVPPDKLDRFSAAYRFQKDSPLEVIDAPTTSPYANPDHYPSGGHGLVSTAADYFRFAQMLLNRGELAGVRLLSSKTVALMTTNHIPKGLFPLWFGHYFPLPGAGFGLGGSVLMNPAQAGSLNSKGTFGWGGSLSTSFQVDPKEAMICLIMQQLDLFSPVLINPIFTTLAYTAIEA